MLDPRETFPVTPLGIPKRVVFPELKHPWGAGVVGRTVGRGVGEDPPPSPLRAALQLAALDLAVALTDLILA